MKRLLENRERGRTRERRSSSCDRPYILTLLKPEPSKKLAQGSSSLIRAGCISPRAKSDKKKGIILYFCYKNIDRQNIVTALTAQPPYNDYNFIDQESLYKFSWDAPRYLSVCMKLVTTKLYDIIILYKEFMTEESEDEIHIRRKTVLDACTDRLVNKCKQYGVQLIIKNL